MTENSRLDPPAAPRESEDPLLMTHTRLLGARLYLHTWIRLFVVILIFIGTLIAKYVVGIENLNERALYALAIIIAAYNAVAWFYSRKRRQPVRTQRGYRLVKAVMHGAIVLDFLSLTVATWLVGGVRSPFLAFYMVHVILSCLLLSRRAAVTLSLTAYTLLALLVLGEWSGMLPPQEVGGATAGAGPLDGRFALTVLVVYGMLFGATAFLLVTLSDRLRRGERQLRQANAELERLSNMRRDFLHIALHNIQSPVGAATMYLNNLLAGLGGDLSDKQRHWVQRSRKRLKGLNVFLKNFRTLNALESGKIDAQKTAVDVGPMLASLIEETQELAEEHGHSVTLDVPDDVPPVYGIEHLLREAVVNFIVNAIKYTPDGGRIVIRARHAPPDVRIEVEDNGIGICAADQQRLFSEFVRLNRAGTPVASVQGSGLGLSIVANVIAGHDGRTSVRSEPGKGSTFVIELPAFTGREADLTSAST